MVTDSVKKYRDIVAIGLLAAVALEVVLTFALLLKDVDEIYGGSSADTGFAFKSALLTSSFVNPILLLLVAIAVALVVHLGEPSKLARVVTIAALALLGLMILLGLITWVAALTADEVDRFFGSFAGFTLAGKVTGSLAMLGLFLLAAVAVLYVFSALRGLPARVKAQPQDQQQWGGQPGQWGGQPAAGTWGGSQSAPSQHGQAPQGQVGQQAQQAQQAQQGQQSGWGQDPAQWGAAPSAAWGQQQTPSYGEQQTPSYGEQSTYGEHQAYGETPSYGDTQPRGDAQSYGDAQSFGDTQSYGGQQSYGDQQPGGSSWEAPGTTDETSQSPYGTAESGAQGEPSVGQPSGAGQTEPPVQPATDSPATGEPTESYAPDSAGGTTADTAETPSAETSQEEPEQREDPGGWWNPGSQR